MTDRRAVLRAIAVAPVLASAWSTPLRANAGFSPPSKPMRLSRRLVRHLRDGNAIEVVRAWTIDFSPLGRGYSVAGRQVGVEVQAPPSLAALARIEEERIEEAMFPIPLGSNGHMLAEAAAPSQQALDKAIAILRERMAGASDTNVAHFESFVASLQQAGPEILSHWPRDLFSPTTTKDTVVRNVGGPGMPNGTIRLTTEADLAPTSGLMERFSRRIETRIADSMRLSEEEWSLTAG